MTKQKYVTVNLTLKEASALCKSGKYYQAPRTNKRDPAQIRGSGKLQKAITDHRRVNGIPTA